MTGRKMVKTCLVLNLLIIANSSFCQIFTLPDIPQYDSIFVDSYNGVIREKSYFLQGERVFEIGYNTGSILYTPFFHIGGGKEDSCYAYFNGPNHDQYDFYYLDEEYIINRKYSEDSKLFRYSKFDWRNVPFEKGDYYFIKEMYEGTISHYQKYKIGKWVKYDSMGLPVETIDYDNFMLNGKPIKFTGNLKVIGSLKSLADKKIVAVYGKKFFSKYVRFNPAQSGYYPYEDPRPEQPGGRSIFTPTEEDIHFVDLSYDIMIGEERFNVFHFRISRDGEFLGRTYFPNFAAKYFYLTQGLDSLNNGKFHENVLNWQSVASANEFDITSRDFNVKLDFEPTSEFYGELRMVLEQVKESRSTRYSFTNSLRQLIINPWTGEMTESTDEEGIHSIMIEGMD